MTLPNPAQLHLPNNFDDRMLIILHLYSLSLRTMETKEELERNWKVFNEEDKWNQLDRASKNQNQPVNHGRNNYASR